MRQEPRLPSVYRLVTVGRPDDAAETARSLARGGAEDGTLVWAKPDQSGRAAEDFSCALILMPECALSTAVQLTYVGALGLAEALASLLPPAPLVFAWPSTVLLGHARLAEVRLETAPPPESKESKESKEGNIDWLVLCAQAHVGRRRPEEWEHLTSLCDIGGGDVTVEDVLEGFARHFLSWANRWLDDGFGPVRTSWLNRTESVGAEVTVAVGGAELTGTFIDVDPMGRLELDTGGGRRTIELYDTPFAAPAPS